MRNQFYMLGNIVVVVSANLLLMHSQLYIYLAFCFSVSAKGSSKSGVCYTSSHVHNFITSSHLLTFTSSHLHFFTSSHLHIFSSSDLHIFSSSHRHIFTPSYPHICTSSHVHTLSPAQLHTSSLSFSLLHIFSSSSHLLSLSLPFSLSLLPSCPLSLSPSFFFFSLLRPQAGPTRHHDIATLSHKMRFECQKTVLKIADVSAATLSHEMRFECQKLR